MAKFQLFGLFFLLLSFFSAKQNPVMGSATYGSVHLNQCDLPAPDSLRITQVGGDFIALAWNPIFPGAKHQLVVMESDGIGGWVTIHVENEVPGDHYTADNLMPGSSYRVVVATNCASGDPSELKSIIDGITLIVDLLVSGRKPVNPMVAGGCVDIPLNFNWIGFRVSTIDEGQYIENFFEVKLTGELVLHSNLSKRFEVNRHYIDHPIVAVNPDGLWPNCIVPIREDVPTIFRLDKLIGGGPNREIIGYVELSQNSFPSSLNFCPIFNNINYPWNSNYVLTTLVAKRTSDPEDCLGRSTIKLETKVTENLNDSLFNYNLSEQFITVKSEALLSNFNKLEVSIYDASGVRVYSMNKREKGDFQISIDNLSNGFYILKLSLDGKVDFFKFTKLN